MKFFSCPPRDFLKWHGANLVEICIYVVSRRDSFLSVSWFLQMAQGGSRRSVYIFFFCTSGFLLIRIVTCEWNVVLIVVACFNSPRVVFAEDAPPEGGVGNISLSPLASMRWFVIPLSLDYSRVSFTLDEFGLRRWLILWLKQIAFYDKFVIWNVWKIKCNEVLIHSDVPRRIPRQCQVSPSLVVQSNRNCWFVQELA